MLKRWMDAVNAFLISLYMTVTYRAKRALANEAGDTNFISILIILGIVIMVAIVFIRFKETIVNKVEGIVNNFTNSEW